MAKFEGNMHYVRLSKEDADEVIEFLLSDFATVEPVMSLLAMDKEESIPFLKELVREAVDSGVSYVVKTEEHGIVAARLSLFRTRQNAEDTKKIPEDFSTNIGIVNSLLRRLNQQFWLEISPNVTKVYYLIAVLVAPRFRYTDMWDMLIHHNMNEARARGAQGLLAEATASQTQTLLNKLGYRAVAEVQYSNFVNADGSQILKSTNGTEKAQLMYKEMPTDENFKK